MTVSIARAVPVARTSNNNNNNNNEQGDDKSSSGGFEADNDVQGSQVEDHGLEFDDGRKRYQVTTIAALRCAINAVIRAQGSAPEPAETF